MTKQETRIEQVMRINRLPKWIRANKKPSDDSYSRKNYVSYIKGYIEKGNFEIVKDFILNNNFKNIESKFNVLFKNNLFLFLK